MIGVLQPFYPASSILLEEEMGRRVVSIWAARERALNGNAATTADFLRAGISCERLAAINNCQELVFQLCVAATDRASERIEMQKEGPTSL